MVGSPEAEIREHDETARAKRSLLVDSDGNPVASLQIIEDTVVTAEANADGSTKAILVAGVYFDGDNWYAKRFTVDENGYLIITGTVGVSSIPGVAGAAADDAATPGAPVMIGGSAVETDGTDPTSVSAEADVARVRTDRNRRMLVNTFHPNLWTITPAAYSSAQTNASVKAAPGANLSLYITDIFVSNGATAGIITLLNGSGGTVLFRAYCAINGGAVLSLQTPIRLTANTALCITSTTVTTHSVTVGGFIAP